MKETCFSFCSYNNTLIYEHHYQRVCFDVVFLFVLFDWQLLRVCSFFCSVLVLISADLVLEHDCGCTFLMHIFILDFEGIAWIKCA